MIEFLFLVLSFTGVSSFVFPNYRRQALQRYPIHSDVHQHGSLAKAMSLREGEPHLRRQEGNPLAMSDRESNKLEKGYTWSPQDLTEDSPGYLPIPDDDYVKKYQANPELWPVEFFLIAYRRTKGNKVQVLVRSSANGTSKWGVGTGVPATRWLLSTAKAPPTGYQWSDPSIEFEARNFPEFPQNNVPSWAYRKIDIREDAFTDPDNAVFQDPELEEYARNIRDELKAKLSNDGKDTTTRLSSWESSRISIVQNIVDKANSVAGIQGTLRMSGLFGKKSDGSRYIPLGKDAPDPSKLAQSVRIYTMFPQMPDPMPLPSTPPEEMQREIVTREDRMAETGRDPHKDKHGRKFTHKSTSNVSNTIIGVYFTLDATDLKGLDEVPALDLFGTKKIQRDWVAFEDLKVLDSDGKSISTEDSKPTFISGFIVRQLVKEGVISLEA